MLLILFAVSMKVLDLS